MLVALAILLSLSAYIAGVWAAIAVNRRIILSPPANVQAWAWKVFSTSIRVFVFIMVILVVTTVVSPVILLLDHVE